MAFLNSPQLVAAPDQPQAQSNTFTNNMSGDNPNVSGQPVMTQTMLPSPAPDQLNNVASGHTI